MAGTSILAKMAVQIVANNAQFAAAMKQSQAQLGAFQKSAAGVNSTLKGFGAAFGLMEAARGIQYAISTIGDFSHAMQEVRAITNATDKDFAALRENALELGRTTKYTATEVAGLQIAFGRLGFNTQEILDATGATLELASATGEDLAKSADIAGSTLRAFNLDASEMQRVVDVMAASFNKSALGLDNFGEAIKYVAPVAAAANISLEETTAMLGVLADAGIRGSMAGTSLRKIISDVGGESGTLAEKLQKLAAKGLTGADAMDEVGRTAYASLLILAKHTEKVNEATEAYKNANGEAKKMSNLMQDDLWGDVKLLTSAMDGFILKFSEGEGGLRDFTQAMTELITFLSEDDVVSLLKGWAELILLIPLATKRAIEEIAALNDESEALVESADKFDKMMADRRKKWEDSIVKPIASKDWNPFGSWWDGAEKANDAVNSHIVTLESLEQKEKDLLEQLKQVDVQDKKKLTSIASEILATRAQIKVIEDLIDVKGKSKSKELKMVFTPDLEAEGSLNPELRNDQARNAALEFAKSLDQVATSAEFAGGAVIKLEEATGVLMKEMMDIGPMVAGGITNIASALGQAAVEGGNFGEALLDSLGGFMQSFGASLIALGIGKIALENFGGPAMLAAGFALTAAGAALSASVSKGPDLSGGGSGAGGRASSGISRFNANTSVQDSSPQLVTVLKGEDVWIMLQNYQAGKHYTGG